MVIGGVEVDLGDRLPQPALQIGGGVGRTEHLGQRVDHVVGRAEPVGAVPRWVTQDLVADDVQRGGDPGAHLAGAHQVTTGDRGGGQAEGRSARPAGHQAGVQQSAEVDHVGLLRAEVRRPGQRVARRRPECCLDQQTHDLDVTVGGEDDGVRVDPLVVQTETVDAGQGVGDLADHPGRLQTRERAVTEQHLQGAPDRVLADDVGAELRVLAVHGVEHPQEAGVDRQRGAPGGLQDVGCLGIQRGEQMHHHRAGQHQVERPPGHRPGRLGEQLLHPVAVAEHGAGAGDDGGQGARRGVGGEAVAAAGRVLTAIRLVQWLGGGGHPAEDVGGSGSRGRRRCRAGHPVRAGKGHHVIRVLGRAGHWGGVGGCPDARRDHRPDDGGIAVVGAIACGRACPAGPTGPFCRSCRESPVDSDRLLGDLRRRVALVGGRVSRRTAPAAAQHGGDDVGHLADPQQPGHPGVRARRRSARPPRAPGRGPAGCRRAPATGSARRPGPRARRPAGS